ncbi:hypothetical protein GN956_G6100 [Arapaima gigas]
MWCASESGSTPALHGHVTVTTEDHGDVPISEIVPQRVLSVKTQLRRPLSSGRTFPRSLRYPDLALGFPPGLPRVRSDAGLEEKPDSVSAEDARRR